MNAAGRTLGNYRIGGELGRGGMGTVYRAESVADGPAGPAGSVVAVKVFHPHLIGEERALERFQREAEIGMQVRHAHVVRTFEVGCQEVEGQPLHYLVMELIEGQNLADLLKELGKVPETLLAQVAEQVLDALAEVHSRGVVHRDVKPANIVITPDHRVLVTDLGIARLQQRGHTLTQAAEFVGSLAYAAPEQFLPEESAIGPAADLYAFGVVLFEMATGRNPFDLENLNAILQQKMQAGLPPPRSVDPGIDPFWNEFILTATRKDLSERFASAEEMRRVLAEGEAGEWWRARRAQVGASGAQRALKRIRLERETPLIGRADALDRLGRAWAGARERGGALILSGASGVGKSRLLYDFLEQVGARNGSSLAAARCAGGGARSYQPFVEAMLDLLAPQEGSPTERRAALESRLGPLLVDTPGVVPQYVDFLLGGVQPGVEGAFSKDALLSATARVLERLAAEHPVILAIDDLHLAGAESVEMFRALTRSVGERPVLLLGVSSEDEVEEGSPLHALLASNDPGLARVGLAPLDYAATEDLVRAVVREERTVRALARPLFERADGNAYLVLEILAQMRTEGVLVPRGEGLELARPLDARTVPASVRDVVRLKLSRLDEAQRETLETAAVVGYEFDAALLSAVLDQNRIHLLKRLAVLERKNRLVVSSGAAGFRFAGRHLYEAVSEGIPEALRSEMHGLVADTIRSRIAAAGLAKPDGATAYALLGHLLQAGRPLEAEPFLEDAIDHLVRRFHASWAAPFLERVAAAFREAAPAKRLAIAMKRWTCYELLASRADQMRVLDEARQLADRIGEPGPRAKVHALRAGSLWYAGDWDAAAAEARTGLDLARQAGDRTWEATCRHTLGAIAWRRGALRESETELREALAIRREVGDRRGQASTLQALALVMPALGQTEGVEPTMQEALTIWREVGERRGEAAMLMNIGSRLVDEGRAEEGLRHLEQAIAGHRETGALVSEATTFANLGRAYDVLGRLADARAAWHRALRLFTDLGDPNGEVLVRTWLGAALASAGEPDESLRQLEAAVDLATRRGAKGRLVAAHRELGKLLHAQGRRPEGWAHLDRALAVAREIGDAGARMAVLSASGQAATAEGDAERAVRLLGEAAVDARARGGAGAALVLARLARAQALSGRAPEATSVAEEALRVLEADPAGSGAYGADVYLALAEVFTDARRAECLARGRALAEVRARPPVGTRLG